MNAAAVLPRVEPRDEEVKALFTFGVDRIRDNAVRDAVETIMRSVVDPQFWVAPASSTGRYHTRWTNEVSGLVRHTTEMCVLAPQIARMFADICTPDGKDVDPYHLDLILAAIVLHDAFKGGRPWSSFTNKAHAAIAANAWEQAATVRGVDPAKVQIVKNAITWHEGRWSQIPVQPDVSSHTIVVHTADMFSSAKDLELIFEPKRFAPASLVANAQTPNAMTVTPIRPDVSVGSAPEDTF